LDLLLRTGEQGPAIASFRELIRRRPQSAEGYAQLAQALREQGQVGLGPASQPAGKGP